MKILALDTATENCSAALLTEEGLQTRELEISRGHAERILPMVDELLSEAGLNLTELSAIAFGRGPGSFTGVRLAATVTQGLAFGAGLSVVPVSDLEAVAQRVLCLDASVMRVLVCNDARMSEVYWACFQRDEQGLAALVGQERVSKPSEVELPPSWSDVTAAGRGFIVYSESLAWAAAAPTPYLQLLPRATEIALLAAAAVTQQRLQPPEAAIPVYLRDNVAHVAKPPSARG